MTKMVPVPLLSREAMQIHVRSLTQPEPESHRARLLARSRDRSFALTPRLHLNHFPSKKLEYRIIRTQPKSCERSLSRQTHISMPNRLLPLRKKVATAFRTYKALRVYKMRYQQLLGLLGNRDKGSAQGPYPDRRSQLMLRGLAIP